MTPPGDREAEMSASRRLFNRVTQGPSKTYRLSGQPAEPGAYERTGLGNNEGICAGCLTYVMPTHESAIRYHPEKRGGIFHRRCDPSSTDPRWYSLDDVTEAPDL